MTAKRYLTKKEAAVEIGVHVNTLQRYIAKGLLPMIRLPTTTDGEGSGVVRIDREDIDRLMQAHKSGGTASTEEPTGDDR